MIRPRYGLARVLSKAGVCSRSEAARWIAEGRVRVSGRIVRDPEFPIGQPAPPIEVDGQPMGAPQRLYLMLNKPRGVVTTAQDERGRDTVYRCFDGAGLPWIAPVGRLDKASEGLLLFSNDPQWAARLTDPETGPQKTYHVQVDRLPDDATLAALQAGVDVALQGPWSANLDVKKMFFETDASINGGALKSKVKLDPWVVSAGFGYKF